MQEIFKTMRRQEQVLPLYQHRLHGVMHGQANPAEASGGKALAGLLGDMDAPAMEAEIVDATAEDNSAGADLHHVASAHPAQETSIIPVSFETLLLCAGRTAQAESPMVGASTGSQQDAHATQDSSVGTNAALQKAALLHSNAACKCHSVRTLIQFKDHDAGDVPTDLMY